MVCVSKHAMKRGKRDLLIYTRAWPGKGFSTLHTRKDIVADARYSLNISVAMKF